jgi:uncharacterized protein YjbJ (UPF0337 family)
MPNDRIKGELDETKGVVKEAVGKATGNRRTEASGKLDQAKGKVEKTIGKAKDALRKAVNRNR